MKPDIHPETVLRNITCACGVSYPSHTTKEYGLDVCSACHPFFTGKQKLMDTAGRVERFRKKYANTKTKTEA